MTFESYSATQLLDILKGRQAKMGCRLFDDAALQLCASQAAKMSGDARKALHLATYATTTHLPGPPFAR
jgi:Cdc6-like AAA superfamily ATPase